MKSAKLLSGFLLRKANTQPARPLYAFADDHHTDLNKKVAEEERRIKEQRNFIRPVGMDTADEQFYVISQRNDAHAFMSHTSEEFVNMNNNNYLGLSCHPEVLSAGKAAMDVVGAGLSNSPLVAGMSVHGRNLEQKLAAFHGKEDAMLFSSGFAANLSLITPLLGSDDKVFSDEFNHASIIDGIRMSKAKYNIYPHLDMETLERQLSESKDAKIKMIITDGVFSMDATFANLPDLKKLALDYNAFLVLDECHAAGTIGVNGGGSEEHWGMPGAADLITGTLSKSFGGGAGGYITGSKVVIDFLRKKARPYIYSAALSPSTVAIADKSIDLLSEGSELVKKLHENVRMYRDGMRNLGYEVKGNYHPICPVMIRDSEECTRITKVLMDNEILAFNLIFPIFPIGEERIRITLNASHSKEDIIKTLQAFEKAKGHGNTSEAEVPEGHGHGHGHGGERKALNN